MQDYMPGIPVITMTRTPGRISPAAAGRTKADEIDVDVDADADADVDKRPRRDRDQRIQRTQSKTNNVKENRTNTNKNKKEQERTRKNKKEQERTRKRTLNLHRSSQIRRFPDPFASLQLRRHLSLYKWRAPDSSIV
jgi:Mg-chelatase subunit ChlI